ncbi:MAG: SpoIIE family protein phosphatase [Candidatus Omnitrophica bacterium]|nr:SpoIIE family protein phosphatase [Candidatus Omnitrophota bacterium]
MPYFHIDTQPFQASKRAGEPCGDAFLVKRGIYHTTIILADGIGSGIKAHIASQMNISRLAQLLEGGSTLREAFFNVVGTMSKWRDHSMPFAAFLVMRILNDGTATILNYEMPPSVLLNVHEAAVIPGHPLVVPAGVASESHFHLHAGEGVFLMSDGIVQAGLGKSLASGWGVAGVEDLLSSFTGQNIDYKKAGEDVFQQALHYDGAVSGDDKTLLIAHGRKGLVVDVLTGPPKDKADDSAAVDAFLAGEGCRVVCGSTTADVVARHAGVNLEVEQRPASYSTPPRYFMQGLDLVTEGVITLTQTYNLIEEADVLSKDRSPAADLAVILQSADFIRFTVGCASNPANADIVYRKQGILPRDKIVPLLAAKLERMGKLVDVRFV